LAFVFGLRASDLKVLNVENISFSVDGDVEPPLHLTVVGGKTTKEIPAQYSCTAAHFDLEFDFVERVQWFIEQTNAMYQKGVLTADKKGKKLFSSIVPVNGEVSNHRIDASIVTKILRARFKDFFITHHSHMTMFTIDSIVKEYTSHSLKRGAVTHAAKRGATVEELQTIFHF
jgi:hypothetical protein